MQTFNFKPAETSQLPMIQTWLAQEHIKKWLHGKGLANLLEDLNHFFQGTSWGQHWIAYLNDTPFAYLLTSDKGEDAITLDLFICDLNYLGKGLAVPMIRDFLAQKFPEKKEVFIDPEASNARAIHVYTKLGFRIIGEFIAPWHPVLHYQMKLVLKLPFQSLGN